MSANRIHNHMLPLALSMLALCIVGLVLASFHGLEPALAKPQNLASGTRPQVSDMPSTPETRPVANDTPSTSVTVCLPIIINDWPPIPETPELHPIDNSDQDRVYTVSWIGPQDAESFVLEEANDPAFSDARVVFLGSGTSWTVSSPGKTPGTYHYRVKARNQWADSKWSDAQHVTVYPVFVGLELHWDGEGYIRGDDYYDIGLHLTQEFTDLTDADTIHAHMRRWYDPNPLGWLDIEWELYYSVSTGHVVASTLPPDPSWKWESYLILPYEIQLDNGQEATVDGQVFNVSGPFSGYTVFGKPVEYWQLVNRDGFLYRDTGGNWTQRVHPGDITLWYDAGATRLLIKSDVLRRFYFRGELRNPTAQYIEDLTYADSFPGMGSGTARAPGSARPAVSTSNLQFRLPGPGAGMPK